MSKWFFDILTTRPGKLADYRQLAKYHYQPEKIGPVTQIFKISARYPHHEAFPDPIAVIVYKMPLFKLGIRSRVLGKDFDVNQNIRYIARLIVDPRFQKLGIATKLLTESLKEQTVPIIETLTPIDFTNKIFQRAGFRLYHNPAPAWYQTFKNALLATGLTKRSLLDPLTVHNRISLLNAADSETLERKIRSFLHHFRWHQDMQYSLERTKYFVSKLQYPEAYLVHRGGPGGIPSERSSINLTSKQDVSSTERTQQ